MPLGICRSNGRFSNGTFYRRDLRSCCFPFLKSSSFGRNETKRLLLKQIAAGPFVGCPKPFDYLSKLRQTKLLETHATVIHLLVLNPECLEQFQNRNESNEKEDCDFTFIFDGPK